MIKVIDMKEVYIPSNNLEQEYATSDTMIKKFASVGTLIFSDVDGTLLPKMGAKPDDYQRMIDSIAKAKGGKCTFGLISARNASLQVILVPLLEAKAKESGQTITLYHSGGNGANCVQFTFFPDAPFTTRVLYENAFTDVMAEHVFLAYKSLAIPSHTISSKALALYNEFLVKDWRGLVPSEYIKFMKRMPGLLFRESMKMGLAMPDDEEKRREYAIKMREILEPKGILVGHGGTPFLDISVKPKDGEDGKVYAAKGLMNELNTPINQIAYFGDAPKDGDNDAKLLRFVPYGFTNSSSFAKDGISSPPYVLRPVSANPVDSVYNALEKILE